MCEFCLKHGEGKKWYLEAKNYSDDLLSDIRRRKFIENFFGDVGALERDEQAGERFEKAPAFIQNIARRLVVRKQKKVHYGQVLPIEDVEQILGFVNSIVRVACVCRHITLHKEKRYCYGISIAPNGGKFFEIMRGIDSHPSTSPYAPGLESLTRDDAIAAMRSHEHEGLCHTVWTFRAPFIGGICNCDRSDCLAMHYTVTRGLPVMFKAEYVGRINPDECEGCRQCMRVCQFGAICYSASDEKARIDERWCYGCGVCRAVCKKNAIHLADRSSAPIAAKLW